MADPPAVTVRVPGLLTRFTGGDRTLELRAATVGGCLDAVVAAHPAIGPHLRDGGGELRDHLQLYRNGERAHPTTALQPGDEVVVLQAVSGG